MRHKCVEISNFDDKEGYLDHIKIIRKNLTFDSFALGALRA